MISFSNRILVLGYGAVAECTLPILFQHLDVAPTRVTVIEFANRLPALRPWIDRGVRFVRDRISRENYRSVLRQHLGPGDLLIDLAWNIETEALLEWCHEQGVLYTNASVELWDPYAHHESLHPTQRTLYDRHMRLRRAVAGWNAAGATAVVEHGANPGLISHFTKQALLDITENLLHDRLLGKGTAEKAQSFMRDRDFANLARAIGVKVIHCSERDTQVTAAPKRPGEFVNTWSVEGFREEGTTTAELGWGTHEKWLPAFAYAHAAGPRNQICLARMGMNTWVRSWVPDTPILGMVIRHGEAFTVSDRLTVWENGQPVYRPTVHYAYCPCDSAIASLQELRGNSYQLQERQRILADDITGGEDILGALVMGHPYKAWWTGSRLSIEQARALAPHQNATTVQVAIAVVAGIIWMIKNPNRGVNVPDDLPHDEILAIARPYLGDFISKPKDWTPLASYRNGFAGFNLPLLDRDDPWQFKNFLVKDGD